MKNQGSVFFDISAVLLTGIGKFVFFDLLQKQFWFIMGASLFWLGYILYYLINNKSRLIQWGFRRKGFNESFRLLIPYAVFAIIVFIIIGFITQKIILNWHIILSLIFYPLWGIAQQFIILALIAGNLKESGIGRLKEHHIIIITSLLFCIVHFPNYSLMAGTLLLAIVYTRIYFRHNNLWALGIWHGWLGSFFYFFVLGKDAWLRYINSF